MQNCTIASMNSRDPILLVNPKAELYRRFTPREAARIQSFPDEFLLNDSEPKSYKQIGNAIPPVFMWYVAKQLEKAIIAGGSLSADDVKEYMEHHPDGAFSPAKPKQRCIQLSFLDLLDQFEGATSESAMVHEDLPMYGRYRATMYSTQFHEKFYIARGNLFDYKSFWADGIAAILQTDRIENEDIKNHLQTDVKIAEYYYGTTGTRKITPKNVNSIITKVLNTLVKEGAQTIILPSIDIMGMDVLENDALTTKVIVGWLEKNYDKINRVVIVVQ